MSADFQEALMLIAGPLVWNCLTALLGLTVVGVGLKLLWHVVQTVRRLG
jgi:hypothetical protein